MVNQISFPTPQAYSGGADFSMLANLGNVYQKAQEQARQQSALAALGQGQEADARTLLQSGVLPLAQLGLGMQDKSITRSREDASNAQAQSNWQEQQAIRAAEEKRRAETYEEDSPEGRRKKLIAAKMNPDDPNFAAHIASGAPLPTPIAMEVERRNKIAFDQTQKYATREQRLQAVQDGELNINDPEIRRWVALGGEIPDPAKNRLGIGGLTYTVDEKGRVRGYQLSASGVPVEPKFGEGERILGPGEMASVKETGKATGKATGAAQVALPKLVDNALHQAQLLDEISVHPGRMWATGIMSKAPDAMLVGTPGAGFRARFGQLSAQSFLSIYDQMRGAGQITNTEGDKGTSAVNRMSAATNEKEFDDAAKDLKEVLKIGVERAQRAAKGDFSLHPKELHDLQTKLGVGGAAAPGNKPSLGDLIPLK